MKKQILSEVKQFKKIAGLLNESWHPDDPASVDMDDMEDEDPDDYDDISEDANTQGRTSYDLVKGPNEDLLVKRILVNLHNKYGKDGYHYDPYMNRLTIYGEAGEDKVIVDMLSALFDQPEYQDLSEDDYSENPTPNDDESESGDTDAMGGINEKSSKVDHFYSKIIGAIEKVSKKLDDDSVHELHEKLKAFFNKTI